MITRPQSGDLGASLSRPAQAAVRVRRELGWRTLLAARHLGLRLPHAPGLNVVGYLRAESGMGEVPRSILRALAGADYPVAGVDLGSASWSRFGDTSADHLVTLGRHGATLLCVNADGAPSALRQVDVRTLLGRHLIGLWHWETDRLPRRWLPAFRYLDEIWVTSAFVQRAVASVAAVPVVNVGLPVNALRSGGHSRADLGLPEDRKLFLYACDIRSSPVRKNPAGVIAAFRRAFGPDGGDAALVLKIANADADRRAVADLGAAMGGAGILIDRFLDREALSSLFARCDAYVSLHRSEGFGLTVAEAMALGKPVVATAYGGTMEFTTPANSFLVGYELTPVGPYAPPYPPDHRWAEPDLNHAAALLRQVAAHPEDSARRGARAAADIGREFGSAAVARRMIDRLALRGAR